MSNSFPQKGEGRGKRKKERGLEKKGRKKNSENSASLRFTSKMNNGRRLAFEWTSKTDGSCALEQEFLAMQVQRLLSMGGDEGAVGTLIEEDEFAAAKLNTGM